MKLVDELKTHIHLMRRIAGDRLSGKYKSFACALAGGESYPLHPIQLSEYCAPIINPSYHRNLFENKLHNLRLAANRLDGLVLDSGSIFSFWHIIGRPDEKAGYRVASAFVNGRISTAMGGSLCQLSGVFYNMALLAGLEIIERHAHSIDAYGDNRYIPLGRDATVVFARKDLRFKNPYRFPLVIRIKIDPGHAWASCLGSQPIPAKQISLVQNICSMEPRKEIIKQQSAKTKQDKETVVEEGFDGKVVESWRIFLEQDGTERRQLLSRDHYQMRPRVIIK